MTERYCILCGNENTRTKDGIGKACRVLIKTAMQRPMRFWRELGERASKCCGGLSHDKTHLYFHGKYFECAYPPKPEGKGTKRRVTKKAMTEWESFSVGVEMGVSFYADHACTYYLRDFDSYCDSEEYGEPIPYPADVKDGDFWKAVFAQLNQAAEVAFNSDLLSCPKCGYHYVSNEPCGCGGRINQ